jgi:hypothetical protein
MPPLRKKREEQAGSQSRRSKWGWHSPFFPLSSPFWDCHFRRGHLTASIIALGAPPLPSALPPTPPPPPLELSAQQQDNKRADQRGAHENRARKLQGCTSALHADLSPNHFFFLIGAVIRLRLDPHLLIGGQAWSGPSGGGESEHQSTRDENWLLGFGRRRVGLGHHHTTSPVKRHPRHAIPC